MHYSGAKERPPDASGLILRLSSQKLAYRHASYVERVGAVAVIFFQAE
jgi:hypothetical protein